MKILHPILLPILLVAGPCFADDEKPERKTQIATSESAEAKTRDWLDKLGKRGVLIEESSTKTALSGRYVRGANSTSFDFNQAGWQLTVGFSGKVTVDTKLDDLRKRLTFVALDKLPTPGLEVPGWEIKPRTPTSRISKGVELVALEDRSLTLKVKTQCFALHGTNPKLMKLVPADAGSPKSAYFQIRKRFPLELTLTAPFKAPEEGKEH